MILYELTLHNEKHPVYKALEFTNTERHYSFVNSIIEASLAVNRPCHKPFKAISPRDCLAGEFGLKYRSAIISLPPITS